MLKLEPTAPGEGTLRHRTLMVRRFTKLSLQHHVLNLSISSVSFIIPLTATLLISPSQVAYFSAAYLLSASLLIVPYLLALSLFAERSGDPALLHRNVRRTFPLGVALIGAIVLVVEVAAPYALRIFGPAYAANGTTALRILILVGPAYVVKDHYVSIRRAQHRMSHAASIMAIGTTAEVAGSAVGGALWGLDGICIGWAVSASIEALCLLPAIIHVIRHVPDPVPVPVADPDPVAEAEAGGTGLSAASGLRRQAGQEALVQLLDTADHGGRGEEPGPLERRSTHRRRRLGVVGDRREGVGESLRVAGRHQQPGHPGVDEIDDPATGRGDDRPADRHRLEDHGRAAVGHDGGDHHDPGGLHQLHHFGVTEQSPELDTVREHEGGVFELSPGQHERWQAAEPVGLEQDFDALVPAQIADEHDRSVRLRGRPRRGAGRRGRSSG